MTGSGGATFLVAVILAVAGGLGLLGGGLGDWVTDTDVREVGGVEIARPEATSGAELAPLASPLGVAALLGGAALAAAQGRSRRLAGAVVAGLGAAAIVTVGAGLAAAARIEGRLGGAAIAAAAGAAALVAAGALAAWRPARPPSMGARYSIDDDDVDAEREWRLASAEDEPER